MYLMYKIPANAAEELSQKNWNNLENGRKWQ